MKKLAIIGSLLALSACAMPPRPMMANGERCKDPRETDIGQYVSCDRQKRLAKIEVSNARSRAQNKRMLERMEQQNKEYRENMDPVECDQLIISSSGEELCVIQQD